MTPLPDAAWGTAGLLPCQGTLFAYVQFAASHGPPAPFQQSCSSVHSLLYCLGLLLSRHGTLYLSLLKLICHIFVFTHTVFWALSGVPHHDLMTVQSFACHLIKVCRWLIGNPSKHNCPQLMTLLKVLGGLLHPAFHSKGSVAIKRCQPQNVVDWVLRKVSSRHL